jgi:hypothetical protein
MVSAFKFNFSAGLAGAEVLGEEEGIGESLKQNEQGQRRIHTRN